MPAKVCQSYARRVVRASESLEGGSKPSSSEAPGGARSTGRHLNRAEDKRITSRHGVNGTVGEGRAEADVPDLEEKGAELAENGERTGRKIWEERPLPLGGMHGTVPTELLMGLFGT